MENKADNGFWRLDSAQKVFVSEAGEREERKREEEGLEALCVKRREMTTDETAKPI